MAEFNFTRSYVRSLIRESRAEVRYLTAGDKGTRPRLADLARRAERDLIDLSRPTREG